MVISARKKLKHDKDKKVTGKVLLPFCIGIIRGGLSDAMTSEGRRERAIPINGQREFQAKGMKMVNSK